MNESERQALHELGHIADVFKREPLPLLAEWQRLSRLPAPRVNGNKIWVKR